MAVDVTTLKNDIKDYIYLRLGGDMVDVELDPAHYTNCIDQSLRRYRQRAGNSVESSYIFVNIVKEQQEYVLPDEVQEVRQVFRRSVGSGSSDTGAQFEPFEAAFVNTYLLQAGRVGGQATYELYYQYQELSARLFGGFVNFEWNPVTKTVTLLRKFEDSGEDVALWVYNIKPDVTILQDRQAQPWVQDYSLALAKFTLGEARSKFSTIAGPQGGTSLNGDTLKAEAQSELQVLDEELKNYVDGSDPLSFIIG
jgi:hypothetical protein|tara:strand:+ start:256 stop:1014 length:759 start_codon:yes stop_codon:yes gene_type:complete